MFARFFHVLHDSIFTTHDRQRERYLAASTDLADLEHRMRRFELDTLDSWPPGAAGPLSREGGLRRSGH